MTTRVLYKITFLNAGKVYELYARRVAASALWGFTEVADLVFDVGEGVVVPLGMWLEFIRVPAALLIGLWAMLQLAFTFVGPTFGAVAWWAHLAGFCAGLVYALAVKPTLRRRAQGR